MPPGRSNPELRRALAAPEKARPHTRLRRHVARRLAEVGRVLEGLVALVYQRIVVEFILRRKLVVASNDGRRIPLKVEHEKPLIDARRGVPYISNSIRTSRYTLWDFFPKQLFFQFSRVGNFYFLCVGIPQMVYPH